MRLRADQNITSSGDSVSVWGDMSGNGNNATQSTSGCRPTIIAGDMNNKTALRFNGTNTYLWLPTPEALGIQDHDYEIFIVARSGATKLVYLFSSTAAEQYEYHLCTAAPGARYIPKSSNYLDLTPQAGTYLDGKPHIFSARASATGGAVRVDGADGSSSTADITSSNNSPLALGRRSYGAMYYLDGDISEVLVYDTVLTSAQRDSVEQYLTDRYQTSLKPRFTATTFTTAEDSLLSVLLATDLNGDSLSYTILVSAANGTAEIENDSISYRPNADFNGNDSLHMVVSDGALTDTAWINITVTPVNDAPVASDTLVTATVAKATAFDLPVSDIDGTISTVFINREPENGEATLSGTRITYTSNTGFTGNDTISWYAQDNEDAFSDTATLVIEVVAGPPVDHTVSDTTLVDGTEACFDAEEEITVAGSSTMIVEYNGSASFIAGVSIRFLPGFTALTGSYVHGWITTDGAFCDRLAPSVLENKTIEEKSLLQPENNTGGTPLEKPCLRVFPNPNKGSFTIELSNFTHQNSVAVLDMMGKMIYKTENLEQNSSVELTTLTRGIYFVKATGLHGQWIQKIVVQ